MRIFKYSGAMQRHIQSRTVSLPYLHIAIQPHVDKTVSPPKHSYTYAIFIWDTRIVLEAGRKNGEAPESVNAIDNQLALRGGNEHSKYLSGLMKPKPIKGTEADESDKTKEEEEVVVIKDLSTEELDSLAQNILKKVISMDNEIAEKATLASVKKYLSAAKSANSERPVKQLNADSFIEWVQN